MRIIGLVLSLGAIVWVMMQAAGGGDAETVIPEGHQQALQKAEGLEESMQESLNDKLKSMEADLE